MYVCVGIFVLFGRSRVFSSLTCLEQSAKVRLEVCVIDNEVLKSCVIAPMAYVLDPPVWLDDLSSYLRLALITGCLKSVISTHCLHKCISEVSTLTGFFKTVSRGCVRDCGIECHRKQNARSPGKQSMILAVDHVYECVCLCVWIRSNLPVWVCVRVLVCVQVDLLKFTESDLFRRSALKAILLTKHLKIFERGCLSDKV